ncbi:serine-protein kinase ATM-like isoform X3 [Belonocnema kinseyi]|uniref:serine-protein kinase ATM-like isoform X3 n=1 Tax=Belonocnema kinseyi TaxID=2817044 RepID=UPI00143D3BFE|nr:serine-protein kinase ATM-like isoform X3 [Belonocnema kinseyi]
MSTKRLREILELAKGKKAAGRRSAVQNLLSVYNNASILAEITRNSANSIPGTVSWKEILHGVHHIVTSEGDRTPAVHKKNASQLFLQTVKHASNLLNSSDLVSFVLQVLSTEALNFCHFTYMSVLNADIIAVPAYRNNISREQWQELLMICICCYQNQNSPVKKENVLEVIQGIVQYGCSLSHLIVRARKLLPFIAEVFEDMKSNDALIDSALKLANTVCREIATEGRLMLCSFGETMIPALMNLKKSYDKYDLLLILVQVHHPKGAVIGDEISYAVDAAVWKTILHNMCNMIIQESKSQDLSESFIELGCEVFKQIVEDPLALEKITSQVESQSTESSKRRRTSSQNGKLINMITGCTLERAWPMLQIFARLFKQYPTTLKANEFTLFLKTLSSLLMQCSSFPKVLDSLCNLGIALVDVEKNLGSQESDGNNKLFWSEILDTVTSYLSTNENQEAAHRLLRYLIENEKDIIREANVKIGDPDAIHGCGSMHLLNPSSRIQHYVDLKQWDKAMLMQDIELSCGIDSTRDMLHVLQNTGLYFLLNHFMPSINDESMNNCNKDYKFECAWRLGDWSLLDPKQTTYGSQPNFNSLNCERNQSYYSYHYEALKCLNDNDEVGVKRALYSARNCVIKYLRNISLESCKAMYPMLSQLQMLREIEEWASTKPSEYANRLFDWHHHNYIKNNDFEYVEPLFSQRIAICKMKQSLEGDAFVKSVLPDIYLELIQYAEERGHFRVATRALDSLAKENNLSQEMKNKLYYLEAHLDWSQNNQHIGQFLLNLLMNDNSASPSLRAQALCVFGNWVGKTESGNPQVIIKKYYQESIKTFLSINEPTSEDLKNLYETQAALARFSDMQYRQITDFIKSPLFKTIQSCAEMSNVSPDDYSNNAELRRAIGIYQRQSKNDVAELENFEKDKNTYLLLALEYYLRTLEQSKDHDFLIFRVVSLWLDNTHHEHFNKILNKYLPKIASYKFVPLIPQLAPHMNLANTQFSSKINEILKKCALEHPHHTLPILLALKNLNGDSEFSPCQVSSRDESKPRMKAATKLINQLLQTKIRPIVEEMTQLSRALVMLAYLQVQKKRPNEKHVIPLNQVIYKIKNLNNTIIPTMALSVRTNGNYDNIIGIREYKSNFITVGGVNAPKKIECVGTDGIIRRQLVKGQDDMRQDAVMQQVFTVINSLLRANKETKERKLNIRTYKVVPLTQRSGVLEWCENTLPIANILIGIDRNSGIHKKYYPENYTGLQCRKKMEAALKESNEVKLKTFLECCENMHPAFHHFFTEKYLSPEVWFERRLTYTRSIATNSIVGYVLSVGDRHLQNILIDQTTAEVIHIDFGIAFEQGKLLSVPETVPFRLTRDIEVPMGLSGVEGVMRRCCEQTLKLLQEQREIIVTLLQVLLYDPLFTWSISSTKAHRLQSSTLSESSDGTDGSVEINKFANRALLTVQQKLQGIEEGVTLSVEGQVERLIQQARDPSNLCLIFQGWQAYL